MGERAGVLLTAAVAGAAGAAVSTLINARHHDRRIDPTRAFDPLTGLPNRTGLLAHGDQLLRRYAALVAFIDLDDFKPVNDTRGHDAGDAILRRVAAHLRHAAELRRGVAGRWGGDEFVAIVPGPFIAATGHAVLEALRTALDWPASIGGAIGSPGDRLTALIADADHAMYEAKRRGGGNVALYAPARPHLQPA